MTRATFPAPLSPLSLLLALPFAVGVLPAGCTTDTVCGPGTIQVDNACIIDGMETGSDDGGTTTPSPSPSPSGRDSGTSGPSGSDGGTTTPPSGDSGYTRPPGTGTYGDGGMGCADEAACAEWAEAIAAGILAHQAAAGCAEDTTIDERVVAIAERHAAYQAGLDRLTRESPEGSLLSQVSDLGPEYRNAGALYSVTFSGPEDVLTRWAARDETASVLGRCDQAIGVGVATGASGDSYITALMAHF